MERSKEEFDIGDIESEIIDSEVFIFSNEC